ncbi:MAG: hypothetical protein AB7T10_01165 [bacterium]
MVVFVGLGNIGKEYSETRHNVGFMLLDVYAGKHNVSFRPGKGEFFFASVL